MEFAQTETESESETYTDADADSDADSDADAESDDYAQLDAETTGEGLVNADSACEQVINGMTIRLSTPECTAAGVKADEIKVPFEKAMLEALGALGTKSNELASAL